MLGRLLPPKDELSQINSVACRVIEVVMALCLIIGGWVVIDGLRDINWGSGAAKQTQQRNTQTPAKGSPRGLEWVTGGTNVHFTALCSKTLEVARTYTDNSSRIENTNFYCGRAAAALKSGDSTVCTEQLSRLPDAVGDQGTNPIITGGNVALACGDEDWLKLLVEDGTADNPLFPRFGTGYDGTLLNE